MSETPYLAEQVRQEIPRGKANIQMKGIPFFKKMRIYRKITAPTLIHFYFMYGKPFGRNKPSETLSAKNHLIPE